MRPLQLLPLLVAQASAAFLQWSLCDDSAGGGRIPYSLNGWLTQGSNASVSNLKLELVKYQSGIPCVETPGTNQSHHDTWPEASVRLEWTGLSGHQTFHQDVRTKYGCEDLPNDERLIWLDLNSSRLSLTLLHDNIGKLPALTSIGLKAQMDLAAFPQAPCLATLITPGISQSLSNGLRHAPLVAFLFIFVVSVARTLVSASTARPPRETETDDESTDGDGHETSRLILPSIYDCLHWLQFIFLTAGLRLAYAGFYPPVAGHLNWFALFPDLAPPMKSILPGVASGRPNKIIPYTGATDGIYQTNGTYGGYSGFEVMAQMVGAPMTADIWFLMVLLTLIIAVTLAALLWSLEMVRPRNVLGLPMLPSGTDSSKRARAARVGNGVLRLVVSYVIMPLVALSSYQLYLFSSLSSGHLAFAIIFLLVLLGSFLWLTLRHSPASLGALVLENGYRYRPVGAEGVAEHAHQNEDGFIKTLFVLNLVRGITIGGLQDQGIAQLVILATCEIVALCAIRMFKPYPMLSAGFASSALKLALLICFIPFAFPPSKLLGLKTIAAYVSLFLGGSGLFALFFLPSCWHLFRLVLRSVSRSGGSENGDSAPVFTLRQLKRRKGPAPRPDESSIIRPVIPSPQPTEGDRSSFFRSPRSPAMSTPGEASRTLDSQLSFSRATSPLARMTPSPVMGLSLVPGGADRSSLNGFSPATESEVSTESGLESSIPASGSSVAESSRPLGPRWNDYSFREADLFFTAPPPPDARMRRPADTPALPTSSRWANWSWNVNLWNGASWNPWKPKQPEERGFSVVRPARVPPPTAHHGSHHSPGD
ncbi:transient receptor potential (TRP) ion channel domain-containing protein [Sarocladium implicatum]|nr:transient receptor potential (TRP) ion channel domain-containing protein [Sarocladium implicatum]